MYSKNVLAYIDILGFSNIVKESTYDEIKALLDSEQVVVDVSSKLKIPHLNIKPGIFKYHVFSDTILIVCSEATPENVLKLISWIEFYQHFMGQQKQLFIRGSVVYEDLSVDSNVLFGPALVYAHKMEKEANWARIVVDKSIISLMKSSGKKNTDVNIRTLNDKYLFIDYLKDYFGIFAGIEIEAERNVSDPSAIEYLEDHKQLIRDAFIRNEKRAKGEQKTRIEQKLRGIASYHNTVIDELVSDTNTIIKISRTSNNLIDDAIHEPNKNELILILGIMVKRMNSKYPKQKWLNLNNSKLTAVLATFSEELNQSKINV
jgi:hypothetical protein